MVSVSCEDQRSSKVLQVFQLQNFFSVWAVLDADSIQLNRSTSIGVLEARGAYLDDVLKLEDRPVFGDAPDLADEDLALEQEEVALFGDVV